MDAPPSGTGTVRRLLRYFVTGTFVDLGVLLAVVYAHVLTSYDWLVLPAGVLAPVLAGFAAGSLGIGVIWAWASYPQHRRAIAFVVAVTLATLLAHMFLIGSPATGYIGDESYYVPEAQGILSGQHCVIGAGASSGCHMEHPFLVPSMIAAGMAILGPSASAGWRLFPALLGTFSIPLLFGIACMVTGRKDLAYDSSVLLALDVMFFAQSGSGFLDVPETFFGLAAFFAFFANLRYRKFDRYIFAGGLLALSGLSKETALFVVAAFVSYLLILGEGSWLLRFYHSLKVVLVVGIVFAVGLQLYDTALASGGIPTFIQQVDYILSYGSNLKALQLACQPVVGYFCKFPNIPGGPPILPTDWLVYYGPVAYFLVNITVNPGNLNFASIAYYGVTNLLETWTVFVWLPMIAYALYGAAKHRPPTLESFMQGDGGTARPAVTGEVRFIALTFIMFLWCYVPYLFLFVAERVTYPFYIIPAIPAMAMGTAYWSTREWFPRWLLALYLGMTFVFFFVYFPDKSFLPDWLRAAIGH